MSFCVWRTCHWYVLTMGVLLNEWHSSIKIHISATADCRAGELYLSLTHIQYLCMPIYYQTWREQLCHHISRRLKWSFRHSRLTQKLKMTITMKWLFFLWSTPSAWFIIQINTPRIRRPPVTFVFIYSLFKVLCKPKYCLTQSLVTDTVAPLKLKKRRSCHHTAMVAYVTDMEVDREKCNEETHTHTIEGNHSLLDQ